MLPHEAHLAFDCGLFKVEGLANRTCWYCQRLNPRLFFHADLHILRSTDSDVHRRSPDLRLTPCHCAERAAEIEGA